MADLLSNLPFYCNDIIRMQEQQVIDLIVFLVKFQNITQQAILSFCPRSSSAFKASSLILLGLSIIFLTMASLSFSTGFQALALLMADTDVVLLLLYTSGTHYQFHYYYILALLVSRRGSSGSSFYYISRNSIYWKTFQLSSAQIELQRQSQ